MLKMPALCWPPIVEIRILDLFAKIPGKRDVYESRKAAEPTQHNGLSSVSVVEEDVPLKG